MPRPKKKESKQEFISRAIAEFRHEGIPQEEAAGRAYGYWSTNGGKQKKTKLKWDSDRKTADSALRERGYR